MDNYLKNSGVLNDLNEDTTRIFFCDLTEKYLKKEINKTDYANIISELLYHNIYSKGIVIKELALINLLEKAADLDFMENNFEKEVRNYFNLPR